MKRIFVAAILSVVLISFSSHATETTKPEPNEITAEIAGKYAIYAMMASNAYHKKDGSSIIMTDSVYALPFQS